MKEDNMPKGHFVAPRLHRPYSREDKSPKSNGETTLNGQENPMRFTYLQRGKRREKTVNQG